MPSLRTRLALSSDAQATQLPQMANTKGNAGAACRASANTCCDELMNPSMPPNRKAWPRM